MPENDCCVIWKIAFQSDLDLSARSQALREKGVDHAKTR